MQDAAPARPVVSPQDEDRLGEVNVADDIPEILKSKAIVHVHVDQARGLVLGQTAAGDSQEADLSKGSDGFVLATFLNSSQHKTEVLNDFLQDTGVLYLQKPMKKKRKRLGAKLGKATKLGKAKRKPSAEKPVEKKKPGMKRKPSAEPPVEKKKAGKKPKPSAEKPVEDSVATVKTKRRKRSAEKSVGEIAAAIEKKAGEKKDVMPRPAATTPKRDWDLDYQKEMLSVMPLEAQPQCELEAKMKSYTIVEADVQDGPKITSVGSSPIQVLLRERAFYVTKSPGPEELPNYLLKGKYKPNLKGGCRVGFKISINDAWVDAMVIASWASHIVSSLSE